MKNNLLEKIEENHLSCIKEIKKYLNSQKKDIAFLTKYLLSTELNPYVFLEKKWADNFYSSSGFLSFLQEIEKSIYYSKEICFPIIDGVPKIIFKNQKNFDSTKYQEEIGDTDLNKKIFFLEKIEDFIYEHSCHQLQIAKEHFFHQSQIYGLEKTIQEFKEKDFFDNTWIEEYNQEY